MRLSELLSLPMGAGNYDIPTGMDELGNTAYRTPRGEKYVKKMQPANRGSVTKALLKTAKAAPIETIGNLVKGAAEGVWQGVSAPGRAASGEPVTYGDVAATAMDWAAPAAAMRAPEGALRAGPIRAYHGSPHDFDKFSMDKIGTGEGAQAYGHGLYFAEAEDVAKQYRDKLASPASTDGTGNFLDTTAYALKKRGESFDEFSRFAREMEPWSSEKDLLAAWEKAEKGYGRMYEVNINADPADFLDWDAPLSEQPQKVREAFAGVPPPQSLRMMAAKEIYGTDNPWKVYDGDAADIVDKAAREKMSGLEAYWSRFSNRRGALDDSAPETSEALRAAGIPGIKYKDGMSRGAEGGTRNYVVFDDALIDIVRKYGLAGALPLGAILGAQDDKQRIRDFLTQ